MRSARLTAALAFVDLTRVLYFGPPVFSVFLLGAVVAMPQAPYWSALVRIVIGGLVGFSGGFVLNDWADRAADRVMLDARQHLPDYERQLRKERRFTGTRPVAAGIVSPNAALAFALVLIGISGGIALTFPSPHRWYLLGALAYSTVAEPTYCVLKRRQGRVPVATFFHATLLGVCPAAGYLAVCRPDRTALGLFLSLYFWEVGFNQLYDTVDAENDRHRGVTTLSAALGLRFVSRWCLVLSAITVASFAWVWSTSGSGPVMLGAVGVAGALLLGTDALFAIRPQLRIASAAIDIHQLFVMLVVAGTVGDAALRWFSVC